MNGTWAAKATHEVQPGCWADCSHSSADELNMRIIGITQIYGAKFDTEADMPKWLEVEKQLNETHASWVTDDLTEWLNETAEECVEWLNEHVAPENHAFMVEDNSLFLEVMTDEGSLPDEGNFIV